MDAIDIMMDEITVYLKAFDNALLYKQASFETLEMVLKRCDFRLLDEKAMKRLLANA